MWPMCFSRKLWKESDPFVIQLKKYMEWAHRRLGSGELRIGLVAWRFIGRTLLLPDVALNSVGWMVMLLMFWYVWYILHWGGWQTTPVSKGMMTVWKPTSIGFWIWLQWRRMVAQDWLKELFAQTQCLWTLWGFGRLHETWYKYLYSSCLYIVVRYWLCDLLICFGVLFVHHDHCGKIYPQKK